MKREDLGEIDWAPEHPWIGCLRPRSDPQGCILHYSGDLDEDGLPHGEGKCELSQGDKYEGCFKEGFPHGFGKWIWLSVEEGGDDEIGGFFEGDWEHGEPVRGTYQWENGARYEGELVGDTGHTAASCSNFHGQGEYTFANGDRYKGRWFVGSRNGGIFYFSNGDRLEVLWEDDGIYGHGVLYYSNGNRYEGEFGNGLWPDTGEEFECFHGEGILYDSMIPPVPGIWKKGEFEHLDMSIKEISVEYFEDFANTLVKLAKSDPVTSVRRRSAFEQEIEVALEKSEHTPTRRKGLLEVRKALEHWCGPPPQPRPSPESDDDEGVGGMDYV